MKTVLVIGAGGRGKGYSKIAAAMGEEFKIVAVAEPVDHRREYMKETFSIPEEMCHTSWEDFLSRPKFADLCIIATMDRDHLAPALAAIDKGYDILLEKPMGATPEECCTIARAATEKGVFVQVCHVLRFTPFFRALKKMIDDDRIGTPIHIQHVECVGNIHHSHSFVRGNWHNSKESTPMIVQKTCHDMDILQWLLGQKCKRVHSFGSLSYFCEKNAPADAPEYCINGCPHAETCNYNAVKIYMEIKKGRSFAKKAAGGREEYTDEQMIEALSTTDYGKCVFRMNNDVVDHQTVNLEFEDGATVSFSMCAFNEGGRNIRIMGTKGELIANMSDDFITLYDFTTRETTKHSISDTVLDDSIDGGHGGGDDGIMRALRDRLNGKTENVSFCSIEETCRNHLIAFAAEESRLSGKVIDLEEYEKNIGGIL